MATATANGPLPNGVSAPAQAGDSQASATPADVSSNMPPHGSSLYVGDLDRDVSEGQIFELFNQVSLEACVHGPRLPAGCLL